MISLERARREIPQTWHAFFARFPGLTATQKAAIGPISRGNAVLLCAPTASGKTEAILGPLIEAALNKERVKAGTRILVISPTRALCNDLLRRVRRPIEQLGWEVDAKSGDSPQLSVKRPPQVVVTTPESLDSLLSRNPAYLKDVDGLFLDELHLLHGTARGDQLRVLIQRLYSYRPELQVCAASATVPEAQALATLYFPGGPAEVVDASDQGRDRKMEVELRPAMTLEAAAEIIAEALEEREGVKLLTFANARAEVEWLASALRAKGAFAHHGSLSREERLRTEEAFLRARSGVCIATMTLELGIDIGDVDEVVLINPPPNVASFSQRIGRSNRRGDTVRALGLYSSEFDRLRFEHLIECARQGRLFADPIPFRPAVIAQQAVSLLYQNPKRWVSAGVLQSRLPAGEQGVYRVGEVEKILEKMRTEGYLHADSRGRYVGDEPAEKDYRYGRMHAHMATNNEIEVIDVNTGRTIGTAQVADVQNARGARLLLAGKHRKVRRQGENSVFVDRAEDDLGDANFLTRSGPRYSYELARDLAQFLGYPPGELIFSLVGEREWEVHHFMGSLGAELLAQLLRGRGFTVKKTDPFFLKCRRRSGKLPPFLGEAGAIEKELKVWLEEGGGYRKFLGNLQIGPWGRYIPEEMLKEWVIRTVECEEFAERVAGYTIREDEWT